MAVYTHEDDIPGLDKNLTLTERSIYGSSRVGLETTQDVIASTNPANIMIAAVNEIVVGDKSFELSNHLGNVLEVITDRKVSFETTPSSGIVDYYSADVISYSDYYPFGMLMPSRHGNEATYRYGFNGMEKDDEVQSSEGTSYDFGARLYNPRVGRWLSRDPREATYPYFSPYIFVGNWVTMAYDPDGEKIIVVLEDGSEVEYVPGVQPITDSEFLQDVHEAVSYVMKNDSQDTFQDLSSNPSTVKIVYSSSLEGSDGALHNGSADIYSDGTVKTESEIKWNPEAATKTTSGGGLAPSTNLLHEAEHANEWLNITTKVDYDKAVAARVNDGTVYDKPEEKRVIEGVEKDYVDAVNVYEAQTDMIHDTPQKQDDRNDHRGSLYESVGVNSITPADGTTVSGQATDKESLIIPATNDQIPAYNSTQNIPPPPNP